MSTSHSEASLREHLDHLAALRAEFTDLPASKLAAILRQLSPEDAERVTAIVKEFDDREAALQAEIAQREAAIKDLVLLTGATATGTYLQAVIMAPRSTWDTKSLQVYGTLPPEILAYRKVGQPSVTIRARGLRKV